MNYRILPVNVKIAGKSVTIGFSRWHWPQPESVEDWIAVFESLRAGEWTFTDSDKVVPVSVFEKVVPIKSLKNQIMIAYTSSDEAMDVKIEKGYVEDVPTLKSAKSKVAKHASSLDPAKAAKVWAEMHRIESETKGIERINALLALIPDGDDDQS